jgi:hypothetical protein
LIIKKRVILYIQLSINPKKPNENNFIIVNTKITQMNSFFCDLCYLALEINYAIFMKFSKRLIANALIKSIIDNKNTKV